MALQIRLFDYPSDLQKEIKENSVFPSREAQNAFLRSSGQSMPSITLAHLWEKAAGELGAPDALPETLWREEVRKVSSEIPLLRNLRERTRDTLLGALRKLDSEAIWETEPSSNLEEAIQSLRSGLRSRGSWSPEGRRLWIARNAEGLDLGEHLLAPLPSPSRQIGLFLSNISLSSDITLLLLLSQKMLPVYLDMLGASAVVQDQTRGRSVPWGPEGECDLDLRMFSHEDPSLLAAALLDEGTILSPSPLADWREIWPAFQKSNQDLCFRTSVGARDCVAGSLVADASWEEVPEILQRDWGGRDLLWIESFLEECELLQEELPLREFAERVWSPRVWRGSGTRLLSPGEVVLEFPEQLCVWGLSAGRYPREAEAPLFFSEDMLQRHPELRPKDPRPAFVSALLSASREIVLVRDRSTPSSFWQEALRTWGAKETEWQGDLSDDFMALQKIRSGGTSKELEQKFSWSDPLPPTGRTYSVTELEAFLRCPLGWFVRYRIAPERPASPEAEEGLALHQFLEKVFDGGAWDLQELPSEWRPRIERVIRRYGEDWPAEESFLEVPLEMTVPLDDGEVTLRGRADRVDIFPEGLLLLDWKRGKPRIENSLQAALYPRMASERFQKEPLGFLFVALQKGEHYGLLSRDVPQISAPTGWDQFARKASGRALEAIRSIEAGEWKKRGDRCPAWCPHHLLSRTGHRA